MYLAINQCLTDSLVCKGFILPDSFFSYKHIGDVKTLIAAFEKFSITGDLTGTACRICNLLDVGNFADTRTVLTIIDQPISLKKIPLAKKPIKKKHQP
ncbi:MAG: hypothetical protein HQK83_20110 [Fibrobacteria bacterium]|nr:hypothetical protein [Fibrobacteria bacterium]